MGTPESLLGAAHTCVRRALEESGPANGEGMAGCQRLLAEATAHVLEVQSRLAELPAGRQQQLRPSMEAFRKEVESALRLMDSGAAFCRVMAGVPGVNYDSAGHPADSQDLANGLQA